MKPSAPPSNEEALRQALAELVRLKDIRYRIDNADRWTSEIEAFNTEYHAKKEPAWEAARAALLQETPAPEIAREPIRLAAETIDAFADELSISHMVNGEWPDGEQAVRDEYDDLRALADDLYAMYDAAPLAPAPEKQEPVAWLVEWGDGPPASCYTEIEIMESVVEREAMNGGWVNTVIPLYRAPQADARCSGVRKGKHCDYVAGHVCDCHFGGFPTARAQEG